MRTTAAALLGALVTTVGAAQAGELPAAQDLEARREAMVSDLAALRFGALGNPQLRWDAIPAVHAGKERPHRQLVLLVEYADRGFDRFKGDAAQGQKLVDFYEQALFDPAYARKDTLSHYYAVQSLGAYHVIGQVLPPVRLAGNRARYGGPNRPDGGDWRNDVDPEALVTEALAAAVKANPGVDWASFDQWDPTDFDGDGQLEEADGYVDHLVLVYAGNGQSACQSLYKLDDALNPNVGNAAIEGLTPTARECADRIWPHRSMLKMNEGDGPAVEGWVNRRGGVALSPALWARDYNAQPEYTDQATFIHEFGHSLGLPDVYSRTSSNSTGGWEVMSGTASPSPQNLSAWSRLMLGWLTPRVVLPPEYGGAKVQSAYLQTLDDPPAPAGDAEAAQAQKDGLMRAVMVVLPPKDRELTLAALGKRNGKLALYSGQGNELERSAELRADLRTATAAKLELAFDAWWDIEAGWDFAYVESSVDDGHSWTRLLPADRRFMPAKHGHDGPDTLPGFTGTSGDLDGDGKNESQKGCDPKRKVAFGEERAGAGQDPCLEPSWVRPVFDVSALRGHAARIRVRYVTDMAAVQRGILIDNVTLAAAGVNEGFEDRPGPAWRLDGFTQSPGHHSLLVPHYYLLEYRDPYAEDAPYRYDRALGEPFYYVASSQAAAGTTLVQLRPRPGVVAWYVDGSYAWSENDPAINGPGHGYLLTVDAAPNEYKLPGFEALYTGTPEAFDTAYDAAPEAAQKTLADAYYGAICFARSGPFRPLDVDTARLKAACPDEAAGAAAYTIDGKKLLYTYEATEKTLPGPERDAFQKLGELPDYKLREGVITYRLRDRGLRHAHSYDAPFSLTAFDDGLQVYTAKDGKVERTSTAAFPPVASFQDATRARWLNPKLPFGGVDVPQVGFGFTLTAPKADAPKAARVKVWLTWDR